MKRSRPLKRTAKLQRTGTLAPVNPDRQRKRRRRQANKHAAYRRSETFRVVEARAGGRCEMWIADVLGGAGSRRCHETAALQHHHLTYARYGGAELPEDVQVLCRTCHEYVEATQHPTRNRRKRA